MCRHYCNSHNDALGTTLLNIYRHHEYTACLRTELQNGCGGWRIHDNSIFLFSHNLKDELHENDEMCFHMFDRQNWCIIPGSKYYPPLIQIRLWLSFSTTTQLKYTAHVTLFSRLSVTTTVPSHDASFRGP